MPNFQFRLKRVLEWYQTQCQLEENRLALCHAALDKVRESIARLEADNLRIERDILTGSTICASDLASLGMYRLRAKMLAAELEQARVRGERAVQDQIAVVRAAQRRLRLVEKLRERRLQEYIAAEDQAIENLAAESYLSKWMQMKQAKAR